MASEEEWFTERMYPNDVTLKFGDGKELFVSRKFLVMCSPVFKAMFSQEMKEKQENMVDLEGKSYDDFLELLLCLHPGDTKPIHIDNVIPLVQLAHEYQMKSILNRCETVMRAWMEKGLDYQKSEIMPSSFIITTHEQDSYKTKTEYVYQSDMFYANILLTVLYVSDKILDNESLVTTAVEHLENIYIKYVNGEHTHFNSYDKTYLQENKRLFDSLSDKLKLRIYKERLYRFDKK